MRSVAVAVAVLLVACAGMRPALDHLAAGPEVVSLGEGCYLDAERERVVACSIDVLPAGRPYCAEEAPDGAETTTVALLTRREEPGMVYAGRDPDDYHLDGFIDELNARRCHRRWDAVVARGTVDVIVPPVAIAIRDDRDRNAVHASPTVPFAQLGLRVAPRLVVSHASAVALCQLFVTDWSRSVRVCRRGGVITIPHEVQSNLDLLKADFERALRDAAVLGRAPIDACSDIEIEATGITCAWHQR